MNDIQLDANLPVTTIVLVGVIYVLVPDALVVSATKMVQLMMMTPESLLWLQSVVEAVMVDFVIPVFRS